MTTYCCHKLTIPQSHGLKVLISPPLYRIINYYQDESNFPAFCFTSTEILYNSYKQIHFLKYTHQKAISNN